MNRTLLDQFPWMWELIVMRGSARQAVSHARWAIRHGDQAHTEAMIAARDGLGVFKIAKLNPDVVYGRSVGCWNTAIRAGIVAC